MAYRPQRRGAASQRGSLRRRRSTAASIAIARATSRKKPSGGVAGLIAGILVLVVLGVTATSVIGAGVGVAVTLDQMEQDLPDVTEFETLKFAQPSRLYDRTGKVLLATFQQERR